MTDADWEATYDSIKMHEGFSPKAIPDVDGTFVLGYGHNCQRAVITTGAATVVLGDDLTATLTALVLAWPPFLACDGPRQQLVLEMAYQLGVEGLLGFKDLLHSLAAKNYSAAVDALVASRLAAQTPARVKDYVRLLQEP
jgi:lysozyme